MGQQNMGGTDEFDAGGDLPACEECGRYGKHSAECSKNEGEGATLPKPDGPKTPDEALADALRAGEHIPGAPSPLDSLKPGVDALWNEDARAALVALLRSPTISPPEIVVRRKRKTADGRELEEEVPILDFSQYVRDATIMADLLSSERKRRGGFRDSTDIRANISEILDALPAIMAGFDQFVEMLKKLEKVKRSGRSEPGSGGTGEGN
jgi:hypothetical protein